MIAPGEPFWVPIVSVVFEADAESVSNSLSTPARGVSRSRVFPGYERRYDIEVVFTPLERCGSIDCCYEGGELRCRTEWALVTVKIHAAGCLR